MLVLQHIKVVLFFKNTFQFVSQEAQNKEFIFELIVNAIHSKNNCESFIKLLRGAYVLDYLPE